MMLLADAGTIAEWTSIGLVIAGQTLALVWWLARQSAVIQNVADDLEPIKTLPDRVLTLEKDQQQNVATRAEMRAQNDRDHEGIRAEMRQLRDRHHEMADKINNINLNVELIKQQLLKDESKDGRK